MEKLFWMLLLLLFPVFLYSQEGNEAAFFQVNGDTITIYFNEEADVTTKANAGFYRKGTLDTTVSIHSTDIKHQPPQYKGSNNFREEFSTDLAKILLETKNRWHIDNFWSMIQFSIDEENRVQNIDSYSNKEEISHAVCSYLSDNKDFTTAIVKDKAVKCDAYLAVFFMNNSLYIPEYRYNNSRVNLFDLK